MIAFILGSLDCEAHDSAFSFAFIIAPKASVPDEEETRRLPRATIVR
jgi:hypothetical protein